MAYARIAFGRSPYSAFNEVSGGAAPAANPGIPPDLANPRGHARAITNLGFLHPADTQLVGQDKFFGAAGQPPANLDWPVPRGYAPGAVANRSHLQPVVLELLGADKFFGAAGQPPANLDWPNPRGYAPGAIANRSHLDALKQLFLVQPSPFLALDWPNPRGSAAGPIGNRTHLEALKAHLVGQDQFFTGPGRGPVYDYPNPRGPIPGIALRTHLDPLKPNLRGQDKFFGGAGQPPPNRDWPNPRGYQPGPIGNRSHIEPLKLQLFFVQPSPFLPLDWPNPRAPQYPQANRGFIDPVALLRRLPPVIGQLSVTLGNVTLVVTGTIAGWGFAETPSSATWTVEAHNSGIWTPARTSDEPDWH